MSRVNKQDWHSREVNEYVNMMNQIIGFKNMAGVFNREYKSHRNNITMNRQKMVNIGKDYQER